MKSSFGVGGVYTHLLNRSAILFVSSLKRSMAVRSILALVLALASVLAVLSAANGFFFPVQPPGGVGLSCGDGLLGQLDFTPARLILCVSERAGVPRVPPHL